MKSETKYVNPKTGQVYNTLDFEWHECAEVERRIRPCLTAKLTHLTRESWSGGSYRDLLRDFEQGSTKNLDKIVAHSEELQEHLNVESYVKTLTSSPVGFAPIVPAYLSGNPANMLAYQPAIEASTQGAVRVFVSINGSFGIPASSFEKKGEAVTALVMSLQRIRPVEIYVMVSHHQSRPSPAIVRCRLGVAPINQSTLIAAIACPNFCRRFMFACSMFAGRNLDINGTVPAKELPSDSLSPFSAAAAMGAEPGDLFIGPLGQSQEQAILKDPVGWSVQCMKDALEGKGTALYQKEWEETHYS